MNNKYFQVVNSGTPNVGKISIYGVIGSWYDEINARDFLAAFNALESTCNRINIHINSPGGSVWDGLPIANAIKSSKLDVHTYVDGIAYSMGSVIAVAAKKGNVHMAKGSLLMIHSASMWGYGNSKQMQKASEDLIKYDDVLAGFFQDRIGGTLEDIKTSYFDGEDHFLTATEALRDGFIDHIENYEASDTPDNIRNMTMGQVAAWYDKKNMVPDNQIEMFNKYGKLSDLAKVAVNDRTPEMFEEVNNQILKSGVEGVTLVTDSFLEDQEKQISDLQTEKNSLENSISEKDQKILDLEKQVKDLGNKPADQPAAPGSDGDNIPSGDGSEKKDEEIVSPTEKWAKSMLNLQG